MDPDAVSKITAQDFEDASNEEYAKFKFADIVTGTCLKKNIFYYALEGLCSRLFDCSKWTIVGNYSLRFF